VQISIMFDPSGGIRRDRALDGAIRFRLSSGSPPPDVHLDDRVDRRRSRADSETSGRAQTKIASCDHECRAAPHARGVPVAAGRTALKPPRRLVAVSRGEVVTSSTRVRDRT